MALGELHFVGVGIGRAHGAVEAASRCLVLARTGVAWLARGVGSVGLAWVGLGVARALVEIMAVELTVELARATVELVLGCRGG